MKKVINVVKKAAKWYFEQRTTLGQCLELSHLPIEDLSKKYYQRYLSMSWREINYWGIGQNF